MQMYSYDCMNGVNGSLDLWVDSRPVLQEKAFHTVRWFGFEKSFEMCSRQNSNTSDQFTKRRQSQLISFSDVYDYFTVRFTIIFEKLFNHYYLEID